MAECPYVFAHSWGRKAGEPVKDVKNWFHTALEIAEIKDFTGMICGIMPTTGLCRPLSATSGIAVEIAHCQRPRSA
jgi:hypothetical protein